MSALSDHLENELLDHLLRNSAYSVPGTLYFSLHTSDPGESGVTGEVSGGSYARASVANNNTNFPDCSLSGEPAKSNGTTISFPTASAAWGTITHWAIYDHATNSTNMLAHGSFASTRAIISGDSPRYAAGAFPLSMSNSANGGLTRFAKRKLLDLVFGNQAYSPAATIYSGIGTALTDETLTEWADASYARQATAFDVASSGATQNTAAEQYSANVVTPITITHFGLWDDVSAGNLLAVGPLGASRALVATDTVDLQIGDLDIALS